MEDEKSLKDWPHDWIKKIRSRPARHNLSKRTRQVDLARQVGVDPRTVQQWENGDRLPSVGSLKRLIQVFLEEGLFLEGAQRKEAEELWLAVKRFSEVRSATKREFPDFDVTWFETVASFEGSAQEGRVATQAVSLARQSQLPKPPSLFIGRNQSMADLKEQLKFHSLVSIVGPGGIGKTSLAVRVASTLAETYPDGIWMFEFGAVKDHHFLGQYLLSTMGLQNQGNRTDLQTILDVISEKRMMFIFDNCEHIIDACAALAESLLMAAPTLSIMVTSREALNISGEYVYRIPPLSFPGEEYSLEVLSEEEIKEFEAVQLFMERALLVAPKLQPTLANLQLVGAICKKLEGIPLAIELAASRMSMLTLEQMEERLASLLTLLTAGKRNAVPRQKTLKSTIDWSYDLLTGKEQLLLRRLSVFSGGFTLEAVERICSCEPALPTRDDKLAREDMLDLLSGLVNKSLVSIETSDDYRYIRYFMLEAIKEYAGEKMREETDGRNRHVLLERHAQYYSQILNRAEAKFRTRERDACLDEVRREYANLRSAMQWCYQNDAHTNSIGFHMVSNLYWFWLHEGRLKEGIFWLNRFLESTVHKELPGGDFAKALHGRGVIQLVQGNVEEAMVSAARSAELARDLNHSAQLASSLRLMAFIYINQLLLKDVEPLVKESVDIARKTKDMWNLAASLHAYGKLKLEQKEYHEASMLLKESVYFFESVQDKWEVPGPYESLGYAALKLGQTDQSIECFKKSIAISQIYKGTWILSRGIEGLAIALWAKKAYPEAVILLSAAEKCRESFGAAAVPNFPVEHNAVLLDLQHVLIEQEIRDIWNKGKSLTKDQILAYSLET
ncbi:NB-ARC domain-containing protein [Paenibacillus sp. FSL M8-0228]|nr:MULTISPECIES: NB-ARC domain-containing protein [Paenibacillus]MBO3287164.1 helix-turn-helix domain-containing protein [Paenibacillus polymyxa]MBP1312432.1 putative ATPase/transcriptional regulator with XRE-family HTH domain [Paenibacillus sp. 1182]ODB55499.1 LuxR family transcriptional regulator [Paenibacillus polymyxa]